MYKASGRPYIWSRLKSKTVVRHVYNHILLSSSLDYEHPISSTWLLCHLPFAPPSDISSSKLFQIYTSFALGALPIHRREQVSLLFKSVNDRLYSVCWNLAIGKPSLQIFMLPPITFLIKGKYKKERNCSTCFGWNWNIAFNMHTPYNPWGPYYNPWGQNNNLLGPNYNPWGPNYNPRQRNDIRGWKYVSFLLDGETTDNKNMEGSKSANFKTRYYP